MTIFLNESKNRLDIVEEQTPTNLETGKRNYPTKAHREKD